jgi:hypothetical protein
MPRWVLNCPSCLHEFTHSESDRRTLDDSYLDKKPEFPREGLELQCPNCQASSLFEQAQLRYRGD